MRHTFPKLLNVLHLGPKPDFKKKGSSHGKTSLIAWKLASCVQGDAFSSASSSKPFKPQFNPQLALLQDR